MDSRRNHVLWTGRTWLGATGVIARRSHSENPPIMFYHDFMIRHRPALHCPMRASSLLCEGLHFECSARGTKRELHAYCMHISRMFQL